MQQKSTQNIFWILLGPRKFSYLSRNMFLRSSFLFWTSEVSPRAETAQNNVDPKCLGELFRFVQVFIDKRFVSSSDTGSTRFHRGCAKTKVVLAKMYANVLLIESWNGNAGNVWQDSPIRSAGSAFSACTRTSQCWMQSATQLQQRWRKLAFCKSWWCFTGASCRCFKQAQTFETYWALLEELHLPLVFPAHFIHLYTHSMWDWICKMVSRRIKHPMRKALAMVALNAICFVSTWGGEYLLNRANIAVVTCYTLLNAWVPSINQPALKWFSFVWL